MHVYFLFCVIRCATDTLSFQDASIDFSIFADISVVPAATTAHTELDDYLTAKIEPTNDPLNWWWHHRTAYPNLSRMALDYLSVPGMFHYTIIVMIANIFSLLATSTAVERVFSQGRQLLHFTRNRLTGASVRKFLCLGAWGRKDLIAVEDILSVIKSRKKRAHDAVEIVDDEHDSTGEPPAKRARAI